MSVRSPTLPIQPSEIGRMAGWGKASEVLAAMAEDTSQASSSRRPQDTVEVGQSLMNDAQLWSSTATLITGAC